MGTGSGDRLARGQHRASWGPLEVSQEKWNEAMGIAPAKPAKKKKRKPKGKK